MFFPSKFPTLATTIFAKMSAMAAEHGAVNLSQGFPDFRPPQELLKCIQRHIDSHTHQYAPMPGLPTLRQSIAEMHRRTHNIQIDPDTEITITAGATQALFAVIATLVHPGDEVIVLAPSYDSYVPAIELMGGKGVEIPLSPDFSLPTLEIQKAISPKTRLLIVNNPHNPSGKILSAAEMHFLENLAKANPHLIFLFDEVYQHIVFDGLRHLSAITYPELRKRAACVYSFGKSLNATGWKIGYIVANEPLTREIRKIHQYEVFAVNSFMQAALAEYLPDFDPSVLVTHLQAARNYLQTLLSETRFKPISTQGSYFQLYDYSEISDLDDVLFTEWLVKEVGVALIPISVFYKNPPKNQRIVRFCFAKRNETLQLAAQRLKNL
ncbi:methionine aminotransferase [Thermaurantimonas aggregans]|uniref:methionine aminotransferase n=1 Tax=Thermaurantimonas aggregans TaxID=2173829 RepID=UPI0023F1CD6B|nr:methionine aminotransferase [Thermaurantimonas aggregans]MCX8148770.1 methionine aminotransferase [Thermaurantimonas aggregans]